MEKNFVEEVRKKLESRLAETQNDLGEIKAAQKQSNESSHEQVEDIDRAAAETQSLENEAKIFNLEREKEWIEVALNKIKNGKYGLCERCGRKIDQARIEILPEGRLCMSCKVICDNCGEEIEEARILGKVVPLICQSCEKEIDIEPYFTSESVIPK